MYINNVKLKLIKMIQGNNLKILIQEQKNQDINNKNQNPSTFKNLYAKIRKNIKISFQNSKNKNSINIIKSKRLIENANKKNHNYNINSFFAKKIEESRNCKINNKDELYDNNQDEELFDCNDTIFTNNQKNVNIHNTSYNKIIISNLKSSKNENKYDEHEKNYKRKELNYYSYKDKEYKDELKTHNNKIFLLNKSIKSNKELKKIIIGSNSDKKEYIHNNGLKNRINEKEETSFFDQRIKLFLHKKLFAKEEFLKAKKTNETINSARLVNYNNHKLNINIDINNELKNDSIKKTLKMNNNLQKNSKLNDKDLDYKSKIKKNKLIRLLTKQNSKNHSISINSNHKTLFLNDTFKDNVNKTKKKYSIANIYNYPNIINNNNQTITYDKDMLFDSADKKNKDIEEKNFFNNMDNTCISLSNTINMNNSINNNNNNSKKNNTNEKNISLSKYCNSSKKPFNQGKISTVFDSNLNFGLIKRIFNSPSDKDIKNNITNYLEMSNFNNNNKYKDSLEIFNNKKDNCIYKELIIYIKILNQVINTQKKIIEDYIKKEINLKKEIEKKDKEIKTYKMACLKLMFYLKQEKEINISNEINKKRNMIENQLIKENNFLRILIGSSVFKIQKNINYRNNFNNLDIYNKSFCNSKSKENDSLVSFYNLKKDNYNNHYIFQINKYCNTSKGKSGNRNINIFNKKRLKSYENRKNKVKRDTFIKSYNNSLREDEIKTNKKYIT